MSLLRVAAVVATLVLGACGGSQKTDGDDGPQTAVEKQRLESKDKDSDGGKWGGWRYQGDRNDCFYVLGRRCFKSEKSACNAAKCKSPLLCKATGGGPATVACEKPE